MTTDESAFNYQLLTWDGVLDLAAIYAVALKDPDVMNGFVPIRERVESRQQYEIFDVMHAPHISIDLSLPSEKLAAEYRKACLREAARAVLAILSAAEGLDSERSIDAKALLAAARAAGPPVTLGD